MSSVKWRTFCLGLNVLTYVAQLKRRHMAPLAPNKSLNFNKNENRARRLGVESKNVKKVFSPKY